MAKKKLNIELGFFSKLIETGDFTLVQDKQIKARFFSTKEYKRAFAYINEYYLKNGELPTSRVFNRQFPLIKLETYVHPETLQETVGTDESLVFWCNELRQKTTHNTLCDIIESSGEKLETLDTEKAYDILKKGIIQIENEIVETSSIDITQDAENRKQAYLERKNNQGMIGIPMGIDKLDFILKGMQPKQLITLIAKTGVGKSWFLLLIAAYCQLNGYKVLIFTTEMSEEMMEDRIEAVLVGMMMGPFNYGKFKSGMLSPQEEEMYFKFLDKKESLEPLIIESATGVSNVNAKIDQHNPDLVLVDSAYLMEDDRGAEQDWLRVAHITRDLKQLAKRKKLPIMINSQADSTTSTKTGPELENIGYAKAIGQDSDVVLSLFRDETMINDREMKVKILKQREGILGSVMLNWDFTTMNFSAIYSETAEGTSYEADDEDIDDGVIGL